MQCVTTRLLVLLACCLQREQALLVLHVDAFLAAKTSALITKTLTFMNNALFWFHNEMIAWKARQVPFARLP